MNNQVLTYYALLSKIYIQKSVDHNLDSSYARTHGWFLLTQIEDSLDCHFAELLVFRIPSDAGDSLAEKIGKSLRISLQPCLDEFETLETFFHDLRVLVLSLEDETDEHAQFEVQHNLTCLFAELDQLLQYFYGVFSG